jgi:hypothetical protein
VVIMPLGIVIAGMGMRAQYNADVLSARSGKYMPRMSCLLLGQLQVHPDREHKFRICQVQLH